MKKEFWVFLIVRKLMELVKNGRISPLSATPDFFYFELMGLAKATAKLWFQSVVIYLLFFYVELSLC